MKIGIDLDGVVFDSEKTFRIYEELFDILVLKGINLINREEPKHQQRYDWTEAQTKQFQEQFYLKVSKASNLMPGFKEVFSLLKKNNKHEFVVITARGMDVKEMQDDAIRLLNENDIKFDKYYWRVRDKVQICKQENIELMIDDDWRIIEKMKENKIKSLYFRDTNLKKLEENEFVTEVNNWGDIYRYLDSKEQ